MATPPQPLHGFLARCRRLGRIRTTAVAVVDVTLGVAGLALVGSLLAGWTLRGDLLAVLVLGLLVIGTSARITAAVVGTRRAHGTPQAGLLPTARTVARTRGPLGRTTPSEHHAALRHEILGATELQAHLGAQDRARLGFSPDLASRYVEAVAARVRAVDADPAWAIPKPRWRPRLSALAAMVAALALASLWPGLDRGFALLSTATDGRPPPPPRPVWSSLALEVVYPAHTDRASRTIPNPSGALRVPAGTEVRVAMHPRAQTDAAKIIVTHDPTELGRAPAPTVVELAIDADHPHPQDQARWWSGTFMARSSGTWTIVLLDDPDEPVSEATRRSPALPIELEPDRPPEVELRPPAQLDREPSETDAIDLRFSARDDFGIASATLVYQLPDGQAHRIDIGSPPGDGRSWRHRYTWDLSQIPIEERTEIIYWIEVRDNDPGLGLEPLPDPPGKVTRSATMRLLVRDEEAEHAANIMRVRDLRNMAVDLLAHRMTTDAFRGGSGDDAPPLGERAAQARKLSEETEQLLIALTSLIDAFSVDTMVHERDIATLAEIHGRLVQLHRRERKLYEQMPPGMEHRAPDAVPPVLSRLRPRNKRMIRQLEDEIIRIDDLVDSQIIERLEGLVARLRATQQKLVQLLEQLNSGDESVRPRIEQLELRRREDLRRIAEARAMLKKQIGEEFMNLDAFELLREMEQTEQSDDMQKRLEQARGELQQIEQLHDQVQERAGQGSGAAQLSEEERRRMKLLRQLSRLQDEQGRLRASTDGIHEQWRESVSDEPIPPEVMEQMTKRAEALSKRLDRINDARLGREGRRGLEDAQTALERLQTLREQADPKMLQANELADKARDGLQRATSGSEPSEREGKAVRRAARQMGHLRRRLSRQLPDPDTVLKPEALQELGEIAQRQAGVRKRGDELAGSELSEPLPEQGRRALKQALDSMGEATGDLRRRAPAPAMDAQKQAWEAIEQAIDSLRQGARPPPRAGGGDASTEAERDRSLRNELLEAMREGAPEDFHGEVEEYYEELLR